MVRIDENLKCPECGSVWSDIIVDEIFHKVRKRICFESCKLHREVITDLGFSIQEKLKHDKKLQKDFKYKNT